MKRQNLLILAAALAGWWWYRRRKNGAESRSTVPLNVNASTQIVNEDETGLALNEILKTISANPDLRTSFDFFGKGIDVSFNQTPPPIGIRKGIGGQPGILIP